MSRRGWGCVLPPLGERCEALLFCCQATGCLWQQSLFSKGLECPFVSWEQCIFMVQEVHEEFTLIRAVIVNGGYERECGSIFEFSCLLSIVTWESICLRRQVLSFSQLITAVWLVGCGLYACGFLQALNSPRWLVNGPLSFSTENMSTFRNVIRFDSIISS